MIDCSKYKTKKELFTYLKENKSDLIEMKKSVMKKADAFFTPTQKAEVTEEVNKSEVTKNENATELNKTIIGNTYYWIDSHYDVHVKNCFKKSIKERADKIFHLHDHEFKITSQVGKFSKLYEKQIAWKDLGVSIEGNTTALFADTTIKRSQNSFVFDEYKDGNINQHSVGMNYVKVQLALNSEEEEDVEYKELFDDYIDLIGNKTKALEAGFFWVVKEAKLLEISAVLLGSNELTPTLDPETKEEVNEIITETVEEIKEEVKEEKKDQTFTALEFAEKLRDKLRAR